MAVFIDIQDIRHGDRPFCAAGVRRFCARTGIDYAALMGGGVTNDELRATGQCLGIEVARNAEERTGVAPAESGDGQEKEVQTDGRL